MQPSLRTRFFYARKHLAKLVRYGGFRQRCDVCGRRARAFRAFDARSRSRPGGVIPPVVFPNSVCPWCEANLRHRLLWRVVGPRLCARVTELSRPVQVLHFAPEAQIRPLIQATMGVAYVSSDITRTDVDLRLDMTCLALPDAAFDVAIAVHVLEHIPDDRRAIGELFRVLAPGGWAALMVPLLGAVTQEDPTVDSDEERVRRYGQSNHVRMYGMDFGDRLRAVGFEVEALHYTDVFQDRAERHSQHEMEGVLFLATKPFSSVEAR